MCLSASWPLEDKQNQFILQTAIVNKFFKKRKKTVFASGSLARKLSHLRGGIGIYGIIA